MMQGAFCGLLSTTPAALSRWGGALVEAGLRSAAPARAPHGQIPGSALWWMDGTPHAQWHRDEQVQILLLGRPHWLGSGDDERLLPLSGLGQAFSREGAQFLARLGGPFALCLLRPKSGELLLAVDRFAIQNLFYLRDGGDLAWSTNLARLASHPLVEHRLAPQALYEYLFFHCVPGPATIHAGVQRLLPGHYLHLRDGHHEIRPYWVPEYSEGGPAPDITHLPSLLEAAVARCAPAGPQACFLSGGLDSSAVAGMLARHHPGAVTAFTIGFEAPGYDEMEYARSVARHFGVAHAAYYVTADDIVDTLPTLVESFDGPFGNASAVPTYFCARLAREHGFTRMLAGDGGDELFGGNSRYQTQLLLSQYARLPASLRSSLLEPVAQRLPGWACRGPVGKLASYIRQASSPFPDRLMRWNLLNVIPPGSFLNREFLHGIELGQPLQRLREMDDAAPGTSLINRNLRLDLRLTLADSDLPKVTRMSAHAGVEVAFPLLDEAIFDYAAALPVTGKVTRRTLRPAFRAAFRDFLPLSTLAKPKQGFGLPFGVWLREDRGLREFASAQLLALEECGILRRGFRAEYLDGRFTTHPAFYGVLVWILMTLALWLQANPVRHSRANPTPSEP